jgi:hypothetical protein
MHTLNNPMPQDEADTGSITFAVVNEDTMRVTWRPVVSGEVTTREVARDKARTMYRNLLAAGWTR